MANVYAGTGDATLLKLTGGGTWSNARGDVSTSGINQSSVTYGSIWNKVTAGRGSLTHYVYRFYMPFDLSGESGTADSVNLNIYSDNLGTDATNESTIYLVESTGLAGSGNDFGNIFSSGTTLRTLLGSGTTTTTLGYHTISLNSDGVDAVNTAISLGETMTVGAIGYYDYNDSAPPTDGNQVSIRVYHTNYTGTNRDPYLDITYAAAATDNAIFFGTNF